MLAYSGVRAMRRNRNQADIAMTLAPRLMVCADDAQTGVFSCRTGVRLERARMEAGDLAEVAFKFADDLHVSLHLLDRSEGVNVAEFGRGERYHAARAVKLHRATPEGRHGMCKRQIFRLEVVNVA